MELDEMIDVVVKLIWNYTIIRTLFEKKDAEREVKECEARRSHPQFFVIMQDSLICSFFVAADMLFYDTRAAATSLPNLIKKRLKPELAKQLNEKIYTERNLILIEKIGVLRNQACAHRWEAKTPHEVFTEAGVQLNMMKEITELAQFIISDLAEEAGGNRREKMEKLQLDKGTLQFIADDAGRVMNAFVETI